MNRHWMRGAVAAAIVVAFFFGIATMLVVRGDVSSPNVLVVDAASPTATSLQSAAYGAKQAAVHSTSKPLIVPFIRTVQRGSTDGKTRGEIWYLQRALRASGAKPAVRSTGAFGVGTQGALRSFQRKARIKPVTGIYGPKTHLALSRYYDKTARVALAAIDKAHTQERFFGRIVSGASWAWKHRTSMAYSQSITRQFLPLLPGFPRATDCSGYATWLYKIAGLPDPSGFNYSIVGWTGTLGQHGVRVSLNGKLHVGDLIFYGGGYPYKHVAIVVNPILRLVTSHGSPGIKVLPFNYRSDVNSARRYF